MIPHPKVYAPDDPEITELLRDPRVLYLVRSAWEDAARYAASLTTHVQRTSVVTDRVTDECLRRYPIPA